MSTQEVSEQYARIVTNYNEIADITDLIRMGGTDTDGQKVKLVKDTVLTFEDGQVRATSFDGMNSVWNDVRVDFDGIKREGKLVIGSISEFRKYLKRFGENTIVEQVERDDGMWLEFKDEDRKNGAYPARDEEHIKSVKNTDQLPFRFDEGDDCPVAPSKNIDLDTFIVTEVSEIKNIIDDGDTTDVRKYPMSVEDGEVTVMVGDDSGYIQTQFSAEGEGEASSVYAYGVDNVFSNLSGEVTIFLADEAPMWVHQDGESHTLDYMIAQDME